MRPRFFEKRERSTSAVFCCGRRGEAADYSSWKYFLNIFLYLLILFVFTSIIYSDLLYSDADAQDGVREDREVIR